MSNDLAIKIAEELMHSYGHSGAHRAYDFGVARRLIEIVQNHEPASNEWRLPIGAGVCAYDRDECTVTLALDTEADVLAFVKELPHRNRARVAR